MMTKKQLIEELVRTSKAYVKAKGKRKKNFALILRHLDYQLINRNYKK